jgi:hypothetical protein
LNRTDIATGDVEQRPAQSNQAQPGSDNLWGDADARQDLVPRFVNLPNGPPGSVLYFGLEQKNSVDAGHLQYRSTTKHHMGGMS